MSQPPDERPILRDDRPTRYGAAMLRRFGWFYRVLGLGWALRNMRLEDHSAERIRNAAAKGPVVYVMLHRATLDHLALNTVLNRRRLPLSVWSNSTASFYWQPVYDAWRDVFSRLRSLFQVGRAPDPVRSGWLTRTVAEGHAVTVFLQDGEHAPAPDVDPLAALLAAQEASDRSLQLIPVICVWDRAPEHYNSNVRDFLLGSREAPSLLTKLQSIYLPDGNGPFVQVGEPLDLRTFVERASPDRRLDALRTVLRRFLKREGRVVRGPRLVPRRVLKTLVLDAPAMRRFAEEEAAAQGVPVAKISARMSKEFDTIAASFSFALIRFLSWAMKPIWTRVYSGYDIRDEDLDRIRAASRGGTAVLVPCHKSHFDYLLLSWVLYHDDLIVPHVVAGINLAIWPLHYLLRAAGGFFIKRSFSGENIHSAVFSRYLRELLLHGYTVEFFIEGGRTRSGKLLHPRLGVLDMVLEAAESAPKGHEITLLPVAIAYEQVPEEGAYRSELGGAEKKAESMGQLVKARRVLAQRYGRVHVRVGEPVPASSIIGQGWKDLPAEERRALLQRTGDHLVHEIGAVMVVLPTSLVALGLLAHHRQGVPHPQLLARLDRFWALLERQGALPSDRLAHFDAAVSQALDRFLRDNLIRSVGEGEARVWDVVPEHRVMLDFHKNQILHLLALPGLVAAVIRGQEGDRFDEAALVDDLTWLTHLLRREFVFDPDPTPAERLGLGLARLEGHGAIARDGDGWCVADPERIAEIHALVRSVLEAYLLVARAAHRLADHPTDAKGLCKDIQAAQDAWLTTGTATRPEAFGMVTLRNAASVLREEGLLLDKDGKLTVDPPAADAFIERLAPMVGG